MFTITNKLIIGVMPKFLNSLIKFKIKKNG